MKLRHFIKWKFLCKGSISYFSVQFLYDCLTSLQYNDYNNIPFLNVHTFCCISVGVTIPSLDNLLHKMVSNPK